MFVRPVSATRTLPTTLVMLCVLGLSNAAHAELIDRVAARVNSEIITLHEVREAAKPFLLQQNQDPRVLEDPAKRGPILKQVLVDLVERKLVIQEARRLDQSISDDQLERWLAYNRRQRGMNEAQFRKAVESFGMNYRVYRERIRETLLRERVLQMKVGAKVSVSEAEVEAAYRAQFGEPPPSIPYITVSHVLIQPKANTPEEFQAARQRAEAVRARLDKGEKFEVVAKDASDGPSAKKGGVLGTFRRGELDPEFERVAFRLKADELSPVAKTKFGFHVIKVTKIERKPSGEVRERMEKLRFALRQRSMLRRQRSYIQTLKSRSFVDIKL